MAATASTPARPPAAAYKVSYNRPFNTRTANARETSCSTPNIRWSGSSRANGYDVSYIRPDRRHANGVGRHSNPTAAQGLPVVGHDEYWSGGGAANVEAARDAGVTLAFFSGNKIFWKTRWEKSIDASTRRTGRWCPTRRPTPTPRSIRDPPTWTGTWRDPRFSPPADGGRPENALSGTIFTVNCGVATDASQVPAADGKMRFWRNTSDRRRSRRGQTATLPIGHAGLRVGRGPRQRRPPCGLVDMSTTMSRRRSDFMDYGITYGPGTATHT